MGHVVSDPALKWKGAIVYFEIHGEFDQAPNPSFIVTASVGAGGQNREADVRWVQERLNLVPAESGGPSPPLEVDGLIGPKTIAAIHKFQLARLGWSDGRVDTFGPTILELTTDVPNERRDSSSEKGVIFNAVHAWNRTPGLRVRWVRRLQKNLNYVLFQPGNFNEGQIGMRGTGAQYLRVNLETARDVLLPAYRRSGPHRGNGSVEGIVLHEMGHSAGMLHEHQRHDRDRFIEVKEANINWNRRCCGYRKHVQACPTACPVELPQGTTPTTYDFCSLMHYFDEQGLRPNDPANPLPPGAKAMVARPAFRGTAIGSFEGLSRLDVEALNFLYASE